MRLNSENNNYFPYLLNTIFFHALVTHKSPALTIGGTVLKEYDDLVILGVTFDSKMTFEKHLRSVSRAASQWAWYLEEVLASIP